MAKLWKESARVRYQLAYEEAGGITRTVDTVQPQRRIRLSFTGKRLELESIVLSKPDSGGHMYQASAIGGIIRNRHEMEKRPLGGRGGQNWVMGGTGHGRNTLNTYMNEYSETIALYNELYAKLHSYRWPHGGQHAQTSLAAQGFPGLLAKHMASHLSEVPSLCSCAALTLLSDNWPSRVRSCFTLDPETKLSYFLHPHDLVSVIMPCLFIRGNSLNRLVRWSVRDQMANSQERAVC